MLGLSAFFHDSAAALVAGSEIVAAAQEERFTRRKHDPAFPALAARYCLQEAGLSLGEIDHVVFYDKPFLKFERLLETYMACAPHGLASFSAAMPIWLKEKLFQKRLIVDALRELAPGMSRSDIEQKLLFTEHHQAHAASAFYPSPFERAAVLTVDGVGEWATTTCGVGNAEDLAILRELHFPHSMGLLYSAFTYYTGFKVNSGEYKVMGLSPYGEPRYATLIRENLIDIKTDGSFRLDMNYFDYCTGLTMTNERFDDLFGGPPRDPEGPLTQREMDLAASVQEVTEEVMLKLARSVAKETGERNLCLAGGVALNCVANGKILRDGAFDRVWVQPAAGDAGGALGAALAVSHQKCGTPRRCTGRSDRMRGSYLGPRYGTSEIELALREAGAVFETMEEPAMIERTADAIAAGHAVGWMQGRMEFGPRALGGRSILGDARSPTMQRLLNLKVKYRESFRPFAPSVLAEHAGEWFEIDVDTPYMLMVADVAPSRLRAVQNEEGNLFGLDRLDVVRSDVPAVTHVDNSARVQSVHRDTNPLYHSLITSFHARTGCPVIVNTSFNVRGEPIVRDPSDAFRCFMGTELDLLVCGRCVLEKGRQDPSLRGDYKDRFELD